jgi:hypothetical protein
MFWANGSKQVEQKEGAKVLSFAPQEVQNWAKSIGGVKDTLFCTFSPNFCHGSKHLKQD